MAESQKKEEPTRKAPQNSEVPKVPPTIVTAFAGAVTFKAGLHDAFGAVQILVADVSGGRVNLTWPLAFTPDVLKAAQESFDEAKALLDEGDLSVIESKLIVPPGARDGTG